MMYPKFFFAFAFLVHASHAADDTSHDVMQDFVQAMLDGEAEKSVAFIHVPPSLLASGADGEALGKSLAGCMVEMHKGLPKAREVVRIEVPGHGEAATQLDVAVTLALDGQEQTAPLPMIKGEKGWQVNYLPFAMQTCNVDIGDPLPVLQGYLAAVEQGDWQKALALQYIAPQSLKGQGEADYLREHESELLQPLEALRKHIQENKLKFVPDEEGAQYGKNHSHVKIPVKVQGEAVASAQPLFVQLVKTSQGWRISPF